MCFVFQSLFHVNVRGLVKSRRAVGQYPYLYNAIQRDLQYVLSITAKKYENTRELSIPSDDNSPMYDPRQAMRNRYRNDSDRLSVIMMNTDGRTLREAACLFLQRE